MTNQNPVTRNRPVKTTLLAAVALAITFTSCMRGGTSEQPPVHLVLDMDFQPKLKAQSQSHFEGWADGRGMRLPVVDGNGHTAVVAHGNLPNPNLSNKEANGTTFVTKNPIPPSEAVLQRGQERFNIHCSVCHGYSGQGDNEVRGNGMVGRRWPVKIPNFHFVSTPGADNRVANLADGEYFEVMTNGRGTMPAYGARLSPEDRWAIVYYIRALQRLSK